MNIGITDPDLLINSCGAQNHSINVMKILNNYHNIIYFPDPELYNEFKKNKNDIIEKSKILKEQE